jgi:hypothetical protein
MRHLFLLSILILSVCAANICYAQADKTKVKVKGEQVKEKGTANMGSSVELPYVASYSSNFEIDNSPYTKTVLDVWKAFENNTIDAVSGSFADTILIILADGNVIKGKTDFLAGIKSYRGSISSLKIDVAAWLATKSVDKDEHWVCVWADEIQTSSDGKTQTTPLHEIWRVNKDGKVDYMRQYAGAPPKM